jgi:hypothetical protein
MTGLSGGRSDAPRDPSGDVGTRGINGERLQGRNDDQIEVLKCDGAYQDFISDHECSAEGVSLAE